MSLKKKLAFIEDIEEFFPIPSIILKMMVKINNPKTTVTEIEKLINKDPVLGPYILKLANSLIFGLQEKVHSISQAIILLGMSNLRLILISYSIRLLCKTIGSLHAREYIWHHSLSVAVMSKIIAEKIYGVEQPNFYVFGLFHDIGKIVLYVHNAHNFEKSLEQGILKGMDFVSTEKQAFGFSHIEAGYFTVNLLGFSKKMKNIILFHHDPGFGPAGDIMHWIVSFSNELAHYIEDNKPVDLNRYLVEIKLHEKELQEIITSAQNRINYYKGIL
jgi:putative nucleotidyltransferase with HDIG domain